MSKRQDLNTGTGTGTITAAPRAARPARAQNGRAEALIWLRRVHGWLGLWGAVLGLMFGATGIIMSHRAVMKLPQGEMKRSEVQLPWDAPTGAKPADYVAFLQKELNISDAPLLRTEPARDIVFGDQKVRQPPLWRANFGKTNLVIAAEYYVGNKTILVRRSEPDFLATLERLHKADSASVYWVLIADSIAGSIIMLSITGVILWTRLQRKRLYGVALAAAAGGVAAMAAFSSFS